MVGHLSRRLEWSLSGRVSLQKRQSRRDYSVGDFQAPSSNASIVFLGTVRQKFLHVPQCPTLWYVV